MTARRTAGCDDFFRIDAQPLRIGAHPANGALGVAHTTVSQHAVPRAHAIVGRHGDHASRGEVFAVFGELPRRAIGPAAAKKEYNRWPPIRRLVIGWVEYEHLQTCATDRFIHFDGGAFAQQLVAAGKLLRDRRRGE